MVKGLRGLMAASVTVAALVAVAFPEIPKDSAKALGVTRGRPFTSGLVFVNGKYIEPPYVIERWGTGLRVNGIPVTGQVVDWVEFVRTQEGAKVQKQEPAAAPVAPAPVAAPEEKDADEGSLDDLFDDNPKPKAKKKQISRRSFTPAPPRPAVTYSLEGDFVKNEASKALVARINSARTEIDRFLRSGGFICFGDAYSRVSGDSRILMTLLETLPELQRNSTSADDFRAGARSASLVYLNEVLCEELYRNRVDYRKLMERRKNLKQDQQWQNMINGVSSPLL